MATRRYIVSLMLAVMMLAVEGVHCQCSNFVVGGSRTTTFEVPVNNYYKYSVTEMIYTAAEIDAQPGTITSIGFEYAYGTTMSKKSSVVIYMANVTQEEFSGTTDWVVTGLTQVYSGILNCQRGWNTFQLNGAGFEWTGGNLLVVIDDNSGNYDGPDYKWYCSEASGMRVLRIQSENNNYTISSTDANSVSNSTGSLSSRRPNTQFCIDENCSKRTGKLLFSGESFTYVVGSGDFVEPTLDTSTSASLHPYTGTVTYASSDESIVTVDANTGEVTFVGGYGTVIITATAIYGDYCPVKARYMITVYDGCPVIGDGTVTMSTAPIYGSFKNSYAQMLFTPDEVGAAGRITKVGWNDTGANTQPRRLDIYMGETERTEFATTADWIESGVLQLVYSSTSQTWDAGWNEFSVDFPYSALNNLVVAVDCGATASSSMSFVGSSTTGNSVIYAYSDTYDADPATIGTYRGSKAVSNVRPNTKICIEPCEVEPTFRFEDGTSICQSGTSCGLTVENSSTATAHYYSSDETVATVDELTGAVTPLALGTTTITAIIGLDGNYCPSKASYELEVVCPAKVPTVSGMSVCSDTTVDLTATADGTGEIRWYEAENSTVPMWTGDTYTATVTATTTYYVETYNATFDCYSDRVPVTVEVHEPVYQTETVGAVCDSFVWARTGQAYYETGIYVDNRLTAFGCDDIDTLVLEVAKTTSDTVTKQSCTSFTWTVTGETYSNDTVVSDTLKTGANCDSIITLNLSIRTVLTTDLDTGVCQNAYPFDWNGRHYDAAGTDTVYLLSVDGCDSATIYNVTTLPKPEVTLEAPAEAGQCPIAAGGNYTVASTVTGGTEPYSYTWMGAYTGTNANATIVSNGGCGSYSVEVIVTDANGCMDTSDISFSASDADAPTFDNPITSTVAEMVGNCRYVVPNLVEVVQARDNCGIVSQVQTPAANTVIDDDTYVKIVVADGCGNKDSISVFVEVPTTMSVMLDIPLSGSCPEASGNVYEIGVGVGGGEWPYTYQWRATDGSRTHNSTDSLFTIVSDGNCHEWNVNVKVTDAQGCVVQKNGTFSVMDNQPPQASNMPQPLEATGLLCKFVVPDLTERAWDNCGLQSVVQVPAAGDTVTGLITAELQLTDKCGNASVVPIVLTVPDPITFTMTRTPVTCYGDTDGSIVVTNVSGGTGPYTYTFYGQTNTTGEFYNMPVTGFTPMVVTDVNGCTGTNIYAEVDGPDPLQARERPGSHTNIDCYGNSTGSIRIEVSDEAGGTPGYTYVFAGDTNTTGEFENLPAMEDTAFVIDAAGCKTSLFIRLTQPALLTATIDSTRKPLCHGDSTGYIGLLVEGGTRPYRYNWNSNEYSVEDLTHVPQGSYDVIVTDAAGCQATASTTLTQPSELTVTKVSTDLHCKGDGSGSIILTVGGGTTFAGGGYAFHWSNGETTQNLSNLQAGVYSVSITDSNGCSVVVNDTIEEPDGMTLSVSNDTTICKRLVGNQTIVFSVGVTGGSGSYSYYWSNGGTTSSISLSRPSESQVYLITVTDLADGCDMTDSVRLTINYPTQSVDARDYCEEHGSQYYWDVSRSWCSLDLTQDSYTTSTVLRNANSNHCDSTIVLELSIHRSSTGVFTATACDSYTWSRDDGTEVVYTASNNTDVYHTLNVAGCDSAVTLDLTIRYSSDSVCRDTACDSMQWNSGNAQWYYESTVDPMPSVTFDNAAGCDSIVYLALVVKHSSESVDVHDTCDVYTWPLNTQIYTESTNEPQIVLSGANAEGCDSTVRLNLTIRYSTSGIDRQEQCDFYTWPTDDSTYTASTDVPTVVLEAANAVGCDSTVTLNLVINYSDSVVDDTVTICENQSYEWNDTEYAVAGTYTQVYSNQYGCDSVILFTLITKDTNQVYVYDTCGYRDLPWSYNDRVYEYKTEDDLFELQNQYGCDSTVHYYLQPIWKCDEFIQFPSVVTPNGDGINDRFVVINLLDGGCYPHNHLSIFNRWGYLLYERENIKSDDEFWDPVDMPEGTYFYRFDGYGFEDKMERRGSFEIIK